MHLGKGHAQQLEEGKGFLIGSGRGHNDHIKTLDAADLIEGNFGKDDLLLDPQGKVPVAIKGLGV